MIRYPLWSPDNLSSVSSLFVVHPGKSVLLTAVSFPEYKTQQESGFRVPMLACVERMLYEYDQNALRPVCGGCDWMFDLSRTMATEVASESVASSGCHWVLSQCDNVKLVGLPGTYRLRLNDSTAVGTVQVYAELFDNVQIPAALYNMYFQ